MAEVRAVATAEGVNLFSDVIDETMALVESSPPSMGFSLQCDVESGRPSEPESMVGVLVERGRTLGVTTPVAAFVYAALPPGDFLTQAPGR
jgi:2-dehydropantoate 2-reductase